MSIGVAYGSSPPPSEISSVGKKNRFVAFSQTIGTTEDTLTIPTGTLSYQIRVDGKQVLTISNSLGGTSSAATSVTIPKFNTWDEDGLNLTADLTIYLKSNEANTVVEVIYWTA
jgi:hypothetical protein